ncbi:MAG: NADH-quinone oxidoreductase subunit M [Gemmatimonadaceae bacterium]|nr:NADH-quinone oxidoreductase subunit M [Gemmatimonadaceae bacterium]MCW5825159.1 NADH-quinone oxidoreductase subunit M [Gemmatimonadaceae bacterium]
MTSFLDSIGYNGWILPALLGLPLAGAAVLFARAGRQGDAAAVMASDRQLALGIFLLEALLSLGLWWSVDTTLAGWHAVVDLAWIPAWGVRFTVGVDGIALMLVLLTTLLMPLAVLGGWTSIREKTGWYYGLLLVLTTGMLGVFMALDLVLFYVMWEVMLVPMYLIIGVWGGQRRLYASLKFFLYTMVGSLLMLVAVVWLGLQAGVDGVPNFSYDAILSLSKGSWWSGSIWLFGAFALAFAVKVPMWPFHTWLPDAHVEAPTAGSVILAAIMLKMGTFGFVRFALPLFPAAAMHPTVRGVMLALAVIGIVYGALVALVQPDFKKLVAYSSVSHLGFVMLGIFAGTVESVQGALVVTIAHGISTGALFLLIGMIYERRHTRLVDDFGGIAKVMPMFAVFLTIVALSSIGVPGTNGFVGEFLVLIGSYKTMPFHAVIAATSVIFAAAYLLWAVQRIIYNPLVKPANQALAGMDLNRREIGLLVPLVIGILWIGVYPKPLLQKTETAATALVRMLDAVPVRSMLGAGR